MRKYIYIYILIGIFLITSFLLYTSILELSPWPEVDNVAVNEITKQTALCWQNLEDLNDMCFKYRFSVIDKKDSLCYASDENLPDNLQSAIQRGFLLMDITVSTSVVGKALIETSPDDYIEQAQTKLSNITTIIFLLLSILNFTFLFAIYHIIIKPFERLESFAHKISTGKFDEPLPMDKNNFFGLFTQSFDVMRSSLLEARQKQLIAERAKKELIASLSHDIKTPVTSIKLISELLQTSIADLAIAEKLKTIDIKVDQINRLMNDMLHSTLEELSELKINLKSENSNIFLDLFKSVDHHSKIKFSDIPPCLVDIDSVRMGQVIGNIITNSYKYAGTDIYISFRIYEEFLQVDINDYGKGVESEAIELICTKFYRGENAKTSQKEGEGLGLYIAKQLMEKMSGGLEAFNRNDGFSIRLWIKLSH